MSQMPHSNDGTTPGEQSWIVLDEQGWSSRPPTASPSRQLSRQGGGVTPVPKAISSDEDESDSEEERRIRRLGMDRDVREALELAERSLELAGSADEFSPRIGRASLEDEAEIIRNSPMMNYVGRDSESVAIMQKADDPYLGRNPPIIRRPALQTDGSAPSSPAVPRSAGSPFVPFSVSSSPSRNMNPSGARPSEKPSDKPQGDVAESSLLHWFFGLSPQSSPIPVILSHLLTLAAGYYLGTRRAYNALPHHSPSPVLATAAGAQSVNQ